MDSSGWNMYVFRDGKRLLSGPSLTTALSTALAEMHSDDADSTLAALVAAGELECALRDAETPEADEAERLSDEVAARLSGRTRSQRPSSELAERASRLTAPAHVRIAVFEGFAYYALHPRKIARLVDSLQFFSEVAVVGIRSIGAPLSAVLRADLQARGITADRITVRPTGHPYDRELRLGARERDWVRQMRSREFVIIDEGPGLSGSSFLAVAEALEAEGVPASRIRLMGSRQPEVNKLRATKAVERWPRYRFHCLASEPVISGDAAVPVGAGLWRREFLREFTNQPASWTALEMAKFLSYDRKRLYRFEGFGHFGQKIGARAHLFADASLTPEYQGNFDGFGRYHVENGRMLRTQDLSAVLLGRMADYCQLRAAHIGPDETQPSDLERMLSWNWQTEFGQELPRELTRLTVELPTVCDSRMLPHEWFETTDGRLLKLDCASHGDDHFFPGPCDIAWDIAGAIVEWKMDRTDSETLVGLYQIVSGDPVSSRLRPYILAYATFRMAWSKMAAEASAGQFDEDLLRRDYLRYRAQALQAAANCGFETSLRGKEQVAP